MQATGCISQGRMESASYQGSSGKKGTQKGLLAVHRVGVGMKELAGSGTVLFYRLINGPHPMMELYSVEFSKAGLQSMWNVGVFAPVPLHRRHMTPS